MTMHKATWAFLLVFLLAGAAAAAAAEPAPDTRLKAARQYVEESDRYLHHSKLQRGMKGYGLTVMEGTKIVRFEVEIVSVMTRWGAHQDVILANLGGLGLDKTGVISGMSGSPCFVKDPADGKFKMIGAVAYGWSFPVRPLCGIQPITQMIAAAGLADPPKKPEVRLAGGNDPPNTAAAPKEFLEFYLDPHKRDFSAGPPTAGGLPPATAAANAPQLRPLATPLMVSGSGRRTLAMARGALEARGIVPMQSGGVGQALAEEAANAKLEPGGGIALTLVSGDADWAAVGTVTDIIDHRVLAFGHSFYAEGPVRYPIGPAYVHTVVPSQVTSFKLGSGLAPTGTLDSDEAVGVAGTIGPTPRMVPYTVSVRHADGKHVQTFRYGLVHERWFTPLLARLLLFDSAFGWYAPPPHHTVRYSVEVDFGKLGKYRTSNVTADIGVGAAASDISRPIAALLHNPLGEPPRVEGIRAEIVIEKGSRQATILQAELEGAVYKPGDTLTGRAIVQPFRKERAEIPFRFQLPENLPDGQYKLTVCGARRATDLYVAENPQRFEPRTVPQLFEALQEIVSLDGTKLFAHLALPETHLAIGREELPALPESKAAVLRGSGKLDLFGFRRSRVHAQDTPYVLTGGQEVAFRIEADPKQTRVNPQ